MENINEIITTDATERDWGRHNRAGGTATTFAPMMYSSVAAGGVRDGGAGGGIAAPLLDRSFSSSSPSPSSSSSPLRPSTLLPPPRPSDLLLLLDVDLSTAAIVRRNFHLMSVLFAINHGCSVSVLGLANARLGVAGVWSSGTLYACYTLSALFGTSLVVERLGCRDGLALGMGMSAA